jgi:hypothetical protein
MSTPPPFGDPTNIRHENAASVGKGIAFGCGGCLGLVALVFAGMIAFFFMVPIFMRSMEPTETAFKVAQSSEALKREVGEPMRLGYISNGNFNIRGDDGTAIVSVPILGSKGAAAVRVVARQNQGRWIYTEMTAEIQGSGQQVDLLPLLPADSLGRKH